MRVAVLTADPAVETLLAGRSELHELAAVITRRPPRNLREREDFDRELAEELIHAGTDVVFAAAYPYVLTQPMLEAFPSRILCVHDGDLTLERRWLGPDATFEAILAGQPYTRTSLYFVTSEIGKGPLFLTGPRHAVAPVASAAIAAGDYHSVASYARLHRQWVRRSWRPIVNRALEILTAGTMKIVNNVVWIDGAPGPCHLGEAPDICDEHVKREIPASCPFIHM